MKFRWSKEKNDWLKSLGWKNGRSSFEDCVDAIKNNLIDELEHETHPLRGYFIVQIKGKLVRVVYEKTENDNELVLITNYVDGSLKG